MPTTTWNTTTIGGKEYLVIDTAQFRVPLDWDASSNMFIAVASPTGGLGSFPALVKGDPGDPPTLDAINFTALEADDPTADSATWTETSPGVYTLDLYLHKGPQGIPGDTILTPSDFGTPVYGKMLQVNATLDDMELVSPKVGDRYVPATIANAPAGNPNYTLCSVSIPAQQFDWRPQVSGQCLFSTTWVDVTVDLVARIGNATSGNICGRGFGFARSGYETLLQLVILSDGAPAAATTDYDRVPAGVATTIYLRAERQAGTGSFTTTASRTQFGVRVCPIP